MDLKEKVKIYRKENKLTQQEFAKQLKISRGYLSDIESGRTKGSLSFINSLADVTKLSFNYWSGNEDIAIHQYEGLDTLLNIMIDANAIKKGEKISEENWAILKGMLEREIDLKLERLEKKKS